MLPLPSSSRIYLNIKIVYRSKSILSEIAFYYQKRTMQASRIGPQLIANSGLQNPQTQPQQAATRSIPPTYPVTAGQRRPYSQISTSQTQSQNTNLASQQFSRNTGATGVQKRRRFSDKVVSPEVLLAF